MRQTQFLEVMDRDEAEQRWHEVIDVPAPEAEAVPLAEALGRVLAEDVVSLPDVPGFDRSNMDGFAVRAADTFGASEEEPVRLARTSEIIPTGVEPQQEVKPGTASTIATGGMLPRGADAVVPVENTDLEDGDGVVVVRRAVVPGQSVSYAGTDVGSGETVLFAGTLLSSRETGVLAAIGRDAVAVCRRPRVAILSTGDEIVQPGEAMRPGLVFDSNGRILADAVRELGGEPRFMGAFRDDAAALRRALDQACAEADLVILSGGTSKGEGDLCGTVVDELSPGIVVHGVALKPGKPICLAAHGRKPVVILPGFPTSAVFTFHEFVAPLVVRMAGRSERPRESLQAELAVQVNSDRGRLEYLLVGLVSGPQGSLSAWPMGKGSGSVTAFSRADGFVRIPRRTEIVEQGSQVQVTLIGGELTLADLVVIGSHCAGLDRVAGALARRGFSVKLMAVGSQGGLAAARRGECDVAPMHLLESESGRYNTPFLEPGLRLLPGYQRMQGIVTRPGEEAELERIMADPALRMVNRNRGSGTRILIDRLLGDRRPPGFAYEPRSHYAVAAAVTQGRADWGVTIETVARQAGLHFQPVQAECYDFVIPEARWDRPAVAALRDLLAPGTPLRDELAKLGFSDPDPTPGASS